MEATGSPLAARQNPLPYTIILIALVVIGIAVLLWLAWQIVKARRTSPEYIEKQKNRATTIKDIQNLAKKIGLNKDQARQLYTVSKNNQDLNLYYLYNDTDFLDELFRNEYLRLSQKADSKLEIASLFRLRFFFEKLQARNKSISSSKNFSVGQELSLPLSSGIQVKLKIAENDKDSLMFFVPEGFEQREDHPAPLSKISLTFMNETQQQFVLSTRIVRYQDGKDSKRMMVVSHSNILSLQNRRQYKRIDIKMDCEFSAVEEQLAKDKSLILTPKEKKYAAKIQDISGGGCKLLTSLPIKDKQKLWMDLPLLNGTNIQVFGVIVGMHKEPGTDLYALHVSFINIPVETRNRILADVYAFDRTE